MKRYLVLANGSIYSGEAFGADVSVSGELVFNTGMTGYQETLTDPSYQGQLVVFSYPLIGNYGINVADNQSSTAQAAAVIVHEAAETPSHWHSQMSLDVWAKSEQLPGLSGIDTRKLVKELRDQGVMAASLVDEVSDETISSLQSGTYVLPPLPALAAHEHIAAKGDGPLIAVLDFGIKESIIQALAARGCSVMVFPGRTAAKTVLAIHPDGILLSNGPGDPKQWLDVLPEIRKLQQAKPLLGICLGHQLFAMANGAATFKMKFGHRGFNHAVKSDEGKAFFTAQNHGFAVDATSIPGTKLQVTYREINDGTIEGLQSTQDTAFSVQFHPDAAPGPHDGQTIFDQFLQLICQPKQQLT
ncbi:MAG: carbamoyl phosphate synthase small subunit [Oenococcus sp.]|uniref:carbamoyl phosphate synthase small subunit n=1 Tax=Oenococcus sp. TaxID=1979414 RepID=UPI0039EBF66E